MTDELLPYYQRELAFLRRMGAEFSAANPKIAGRLKLGAEVTEDPHVSRLIEATAFLNARIRHKLEDDFPELTEAMLGMLYPHYLRPIPSMSIVQFELSPEQAELTSGYRVARGSEVCTEPIDGEPCRFRTCYPVTLWPIRLKQAALEPKPFTAPTTRFSPRAATVLRLTLECHGGEVRFGQLELESLRFFLHGQAQHTYDLYELLLNHTLGLAVANSATDSEPVELPASCLKPVGFEPDEGLLEYPAQSFLGYRLLTEYFALPEKYLFVEVQGLSAQTRARLGRRMELFIYCDRTAAELYRNVGPDTLSMGCTPIVNLFRQRAEPIRLTHTQPEYRVVPDARREAAHEIYSIDRVTATSSTDDRVEYRPLYSLQHASAEDDRTFWHAVRRPAGYRDGKLDYGTEMYLTLLDLDFDPAIPHDWTVTADTTCLNRDLPARLPFGGNQPKLELSAGAPLSAIRCLTPFTPTLRPPLRQGMRWRLISHLALNHLSLTDSAEGADALRELLRLYDFRDSAETQSIIEGLASVSSKRAVARAGGEIAGGLCRGVEVTIRFDEEQYVGNGAYLFASVLERFLALYCSLNSFTRLVAASTRREGVIRRWPPRAGVRQLL